MHLRFFMLGVCLDCIYEAVNLIRKIISRRLFTAVTDALTVIAFGIASFFFFCAYTDGRLRASLLFCEAFGFFAARFTLGSLCGVFYRVCIESILEKSKKFLLKVKLIAENLLKNLNKMLYNIMKKNKKEVVKNARGQKGEKKEAKKPR